MGFAADCLSMKEFPAIREVYLYDISTAADSSRLSASASANVMILSHLTLLISKSLPYPPPTSEIIAATSGLLKNLDLDSLKAFSCVHVGR